MNLKKRIFSENLRINVSFTLSQSAREFQFLYLKEIENLFKTLFGSFFSIFEKTFL